MFKHSEITPLIRPVAIAGTVSIAAVALSSCGALFANETVTSSSDSPTDIIGDLNFQPSNGLGIAAARTMLNQAGHDQSFDGFTFRSTVGNKAISITFNAELALDTSKPNPDGLYDSSNSNVSLTEAITIIDAGAKPSSTRFDAVYLSNTNRAYWPLVPYVKPSYLPPNTKELSVRQRIALLKTFADDPNTVFSGTAGITLKDTGSDELSRIFISEAGTPDMLHETALPSATKTSNSFASFIKSCKLENTEVSCDSYGQSDEDRKTAAADYIREHGGLNVIIPKELARITSELKSLS